MKSDIDPQASSGDQNEQQTTDPESLDNAKESRPMTANERQNASQAQPVKESKFHLYVHLASGEVKKMTRKAFGEATDGSGTQHAINVDGAQHQVIGVYPKELKLDATTPEDDDDE